jgi:hypothetical protein
MATDFAKFAIKRGKKADKKAKIYKPFQNLVFLMRDWRNTNDFGYGVHGGSQYMAEFLLEKADQPKPLQEVRRYIKNSFDKTYCFLMPHVSNLIVTFFTFKFQL